MKSYEEMAESVFSRREEYIKRKRQRNKKLVGAALSLCLVAALGVGLWQGGVFGKDYYEAPINSEKPENKLVINHLDASGAPLADMDIEIKSFLGEERQIELEKLRAYLGISYEDFAASVPKEYELRDFYGVLTRNYKIDSSKYTLHDYVFDYEKDGASVRIAMAKGETPMRDCYYVSENDMPSQINGVSVSVTGYSDNFFALFEHGGVYYDIESSGISEAELQSLLESIIR